MSQIEFRAARTGAVDFERRTIEVVAMPYGEEIDVEYKGKLIREVVESGAFREVDAAATKITVNRDHSYERTVGLVISMRDEARGAVATVQVSRTPLGDETLTLADDRVLGASVGMFVAPSGMDLRNGLRRIFRAGLDHLALLPNQAYRGAQVLAVRSADELDDEDIATPNLDSVLALAGMTDILRGVGLTRRGAERNTHNG